MALSFGSSGIMRAFTKREKIPSPSGPIFLQSVMEGLLSFFGVTHVHVGHAPRPQPDRPKTWAAFLGKTFRMVEVRLFSKEGAMSFAQVLSEYCSAIGCTGKQLAEACGIAPSTLSRYRKGTRTPSADAPELGKLARGIASIAEGLDMEEYTDADVLEAALRASLGDREKPAAPSNFGQRLSDLVGTLKLTNSELARLAGIDASYLSRVRNQQRVPANPRPMAEACAQALIQVVAEDEAARSALEGLVGALPADETAERHALRVCCWLLDEVLPAAEPEADEAQEQEDYPSDLQGDAPAPAETPDASVSPEDAASDDSFPSASFDENSVVPSEAASAEQPSAPEPSGSAPAPRTVPFDLPRIDSLVTEAAESPEPETLEVPEGPAAADEPPRPHTAPEPVDAADVPAVSDTVAELPEPIPAHPEPEASVATVQSHNEVEPMVPVASVHGKHKGKPSHFAVLGPVDAADPFADEDPEASATNDPNVASVSPTAEEGAAATRYSSQPATPRLPSLPQDSAQLAHRLVDALDALQLDEQPERRRPRRGFGTGARSYQGVDGLQRAQLAFLRLAATSRGAYEVVLYSDISTGQAHSTFAEEHDHALYDVVAAGKHVSLILPPVRDAAAAVEQVERLLPLILSGKVSLYTLPGHASNYLQTSLYACEVAAMRGECVAGFAEEGSYALCKRHDEVDYLRLRAYRLLEVAQRAVTVFGPEAYPDYELAALSHGQHAHERRSLLVAPPLGTIPYDTLEAMLGRSDLSESERERVRASVSQAYSNLVELCETGTVHDTVCGVTAEGEALLPTSVVLANGLEREGLRYLPEEIAAHVEATAYFAEAHSGYHCSYRDDRPFGGVEVTVYPNRCVELGKCFGPQAHLMVEDPLLRAVLEQLLGE